jgi:hypothetical protein
MNRATFDRWLKELPNLSLDEKAVLVQQYEQGGKVAEAAVRTVQQKLVAAPQTKPASPFASK